MDPFSDRIQDSGFPRQSRVPLDGRGSEESRLPGPIIHNPGPAVKRVMQAGTASGQRYVEENVEGSDLNLLVGP